MPLSKKGMLLRVSLSIPSGRKVEEDRSETAARYYNGRGVSREQVT